MAVKWEKVAPGSLLLDVRRRGMGNTTIREWGCWDVVVKDIDHAAGTATVSWNGNRPETWHRARICKLYINPPKAYREQCESYGYQVQHGRLGPPSGLGRLADKQDLDGSVKG